MKQAVRKESKPEHRSIALSVHIWKPNNHPDRNKLNNEYFFKLKNESELLLSFTPM